MADPAISLELNSPTPILSALLLEQPEDGEARRIFGLGQRSDFGPSPAAAELLGPRTRREVHRPDFAPNWRPPVVLKGWYSERFHPGGIVSAGRPVVLDPGEEVEAAAVHDPGALVAETAPAVQGPDTATITLPAVADRLRAFAAARFAHQPLGPGAPTVVEGSPVE